MTALFSGVWTKSFALSSSLPRSCLLVSLLIFPALSAEHYVAPNGKGSNEGVRGAPWDLQTALSKSLPGDTVWLRGGTYRGRVNCYVSGTPSAPILVRQYPGEHAALIGGESQLGAITLQCHDVWFWGFEIYFIDPHRISAQRGPFPTDIYRGPGVEGAPDASNCKLINLVIHDDFNSFIGKQASSFEVYGSIFFFSGWDAPDRGHGHSLYEQNNPRVGTKAVLDNIMFDSFAEGLQTYAEGDYLYNFDIEGNAIFNSGEPSATTGYTTNIIIGGGIFAPKNVTLKNNYTYHSPETSFSKSDGRAAWLGSIKGCSNMVVTDNYFVNESGNAIHKMPSCNPVMTHNVIVGKLENFTRQDYPDNKYYEGSPDGEEVFVRPNHFEPGRANIIVYNWNKKRTVSVNLSSVLKSGERFIIQDAQNFYGPPVLQGVYKGTPVSLPMTAGAIPRPIGNVPVVPQHTSPEFGAFVVLRPTGRSNLIRHEVTGSAR